MTSLETEAHRLWAVWERQKPLHAARDRRGKVYAIRSQNIKNRQHPISIGEAVKICLEIGYNPRSEWFCIMSGRLSATAPDIVKIFLREQEGKEPDSDEPDPFDDLPDFDSLQIELNNQSDL